MNLKFYLFLPNRSNDLSSLNSVELSWVYENINNEFILAQGLLSDAAKTALNHHITIALPGEDVLFLKAEVPGKNIQRIRQAVPYVLEDSVIDDVDDLYFAVKTTSNESESKYDVSVTNKQHFESVIKQLEAAGIYADVMVADYWLLPENNTLLSDGENVIFNGDNLKLSSSGSLINLKDYGIENEQTINLIDCSNEANENPYINQLRDISNLDKKSCNSNIFLCLINNSVSEQGVNLLQGKYKKKKNWSEAGKKWLPAAAVFLIWLSVQASLFIVDYISLSKQSSKLNVDIVKIYKTAFPDSRRIIDAKAQMKQKLKELKKRKGQSGRSFSEMLSNSANVFANTSGLKIKTLRYFDGRISLEVQIANLQALDSLKRKLSSENGYQVEIQNASSGKQNVTARLQIIGRES